MNPTKDDNVTAINRTQESLLHWYKTHHQHGSGNNGIIQTEESENEYNVEDKRFLRSRLCSCLWNPYAKCYHKVKRIREYRHYVQKTYEDSFKTIRWIDLPGGQHQFAIDRNYILNYVWLMAFVTNEIDTTNKDSARHIRYRFEDVLFQAESLGMALQDFFKPLNHLAQKHSLLEEIGNLTEMKIPRPHVERKIFRLPLKPDYTILPGNNIPDFSKLFTYVRKDCQVWSKFRTLSEADKVDIVSKGLMDISDGLKDIISILKRPLKALQAGDTNCKLFLIRPTLIPNVKAMKDAVKTILGSKKSTKNDKIIVDALLTEVVDHFEYVLRYGELLVEEVWDIVLMIRLSYNFIRESPHNNIMVASQEAVMISKFKKDKLKKKLKPSVFSLEEFYMTECPDTLRKLPVVVFSKNTEVCLHLQGHTNSQKSKSIGTNLKRFTTFNMRRMNSGQSDNKVDAEKGPTITINEPPKLNFVSEGD